MDETVLWKLSYGMYALCADDNGRPVGCIVNTASQITSVNPIIAVSVNKNNYTYGVIEKTKKFALSILSEETPAATIGVLGYQSGKNTNKFEKVAYRLEQGLPILEEAICGWLICDVLSIVDCETHGIVLGACFCRGERDCRSADDIQVLPRGHQRQGTEKRAYLS